MHVLINGKKLACDEGETILTVARRNGIEIPTLCHHEALEGVGSCRLCTVEITHKKWKGWTNLVTSCLYPVEDELEVSTDSPDVSQLRQTILDLLLARCPTSDVIRELAHKHGDVTPYVESTDGSKCIMCYLCVRACAALGTHAISAVNRGVSKEIALPFHERADACVGCGTCAEICPTGHIEMKNDKKAREIWGRTFTMVACKGCGAPFITEAHRDYLMKKSDLGVDYFSLCSSCKRKELAAQFSQVGA